MGSHQRSVKTKSFPGQSCDEKTLYRIHLGISGDAMQSFLLYLCDRRQEILPDFAMAKKCESYFGQQKMPRAGIEPATRGFSVLCSTN